MLGITMEESGVSKLIAIKLDDEGAALKDKNEIIPHEDSFIEEDIEQEADIYIPQRPPKRVHT